MAAPVGRRTASVSCGAAGTADPVQPSPVQFNSDEIKSDEMRWDEWSERSQDEKMRGIKFNLSVIMTWSCLRQTLQRWILFAIKPVVGRPLRGASAPAGLFPSPYLASAWVEVGGAAWAMQIGLMISGKGIKMVAVPWRAWSSFGDETLVYLSAVVRVSKCCTDVSNHITFPAS